MSAPGASPALSCSSCGTKDAPGYFRITRITRGTEQPLTIVCSLPCLLRFVSSYAQLQGMRLAYGAKTAVQQLLDLLKRDKP